MGKLEKDNDKQFAAAENRINSVISFLCSKKLQNTSLALSTKFIELLRAKQHADISISVVNLNSFIVDIFKEAVTSGFLKYLSIRTDSLSYIEAKLIDQILDDNETLDLFILIVGHIEQKQGITELLQSLSSKAKLVGAITSIENPKDNLLEIKHLSCIKYQNEPRHSEIHHSDVSIKIYSGTLSEDNIEVVGRVSEDSSDDLPSSSLCQACTIL